MATMSRERERTAELDYAFLAEWAKVDAGTLTAINASFLHVEAPMGGELSFTIAGRIRFTGEPYEALLEAAVDVGLQLRYSMTVAGPEASRYGDGRRHALFALQLTVPVLRLGDGVVRLALDGEPCRTLMFDVRPIAAE